MRNNISADALAACMEAANQSLYTCQSLQAHLKEERADIQETLEAAQAAGNKKAEKEALATLMEYGSMAAKCAEREQFLDRRLEHAVKCLVRKKLFAPDAEGLMALCEDRDMLDVRAVLQMIRCTMGTKIMGIGGQDELDANCWKIGIDMAMLECVPEVASSDALYGPVLERHIGRIFADVFMAAYGSKLSQLLDSENYRAVVDKALVNKFAPDGEVQIAVSDQIAESIMKMIHRDEDGDRRNRKLQQELDEVKSQLKSQDDAVRKAVAPVQSQADKSARRVLELEAELKAANARNEELQDALADRDRRLSDAAAAAELASLPELPDSGVVFAGGHPNMTKKLIQDHPGWTFIDGRDVNFPEFRNPAIIFFWDQHISHPTFHRIRKFAHPSVPQAYLKSTNLDMLETEMKKAWAAAGAKTGES